MVKTRHQTKQQESGISSYEPGVQTRAGARKDKHAHVHAHTHSRICSPKLERVELPKIVLSKEMNRRFQIKKAISKNSRETQMEQKLRKLVKYHKQYKEHKKQANDEMLALWKNFDSVFELVDDLCTFKDRVEGR
jgi:hypothetical protein